MHSPTRYHHLPRLRFLVTQPIYYLYFTLFLSHLTLRLTRSFLTHFTHPATITQPSLINLEQQTTMQRLPPEALHQIGLYLDPSSCLACTSVLRDWRDAFLPSFWRVVDGREQPWKALLSLFPTSELTRFFVEHKLWIRDLAITDVSVLYAALGANLTDLTSLSLVCRLTDYSEHDLDVPLPDDLGELVPLAAFSPYIHPGFDRTRVFWRLVLSSPGLRRLIISINSDLMEFADLHMSLSLPPATESFLHSVFTNLHAVRHLEVGLGADDYLLANLATQFPSLESFSYWGLDFVKSQSLTTLPHLNLRTLTLRTAIRPRLQSVFTAFPVLESYDNGHRILSMRQ